MLHYAVFFLSLWRLIPECGCKEIYVDLSYDVSEASAQWIEYEPYAVVDSFKGYVPNGYWFETNRFCMNEHTGTHLDAPSHFAKDRWTTEQIPLHHLIGPGVVIDIKHKVTKNPDSELTTADIMTWMDENGPIPNGAIVFVRTGWASRYGNKTAYFGTNTSDTSKTSFPGISPGAAQFLSNYEAVNGNKIFGVGIDGPSMDNGKSADFQAHRILYEASIYGLENVANLDKLPATGFNVIVLPIKLQGGSGGPVRILAILPDDNRILLPFILLGSALLFALIIAYKLREALFKRKQK